MKTSFMIGMATGLALLILPSCPGQALSLADALDTPGRSWTTGGTGTMVTVTDATQSPDGVDSVHFLTSAGADSAWVETEVRLPCYFSIRGKEIGVYLGNGVGQYGMRAATSNPQGFNSLRARLSGEGPARVRFVATAPLAVLDAVDFEEPDGRLVSSATLGDPALTWTLYGDQPWQVVPREATGLDRYRGRLGDPLWMTTVVTGPGRLYSVPDATLPDRNNRILDTGWIPYAGPQRVLVSRAAGSLLSVSNYQPSAPIDAWAGAPSLTWTTGGDAPWQSTFSGTVQSGLIWPGEVSWIEASVPGPGVLWWNSASPAAPVVGRVLLNGIPVPSNPWRGWLHLGDGRHRVRWQAANPSNGLRDQATAFMLRNAAFTPQPEQSVSSVLGSGILHFVEAPPNDYENNATAPLPWPSPIGWRLVEDAGLPGPAVQGTYTSGTLTAVLPVPGQLATSLKMDGATYPGAVIPTTQPAASAPFEWSPWTIAARLPQGDGFRTVAARASFVPFPAITTAEAIEQPEAVWTAGSEPPGLWVPREDPASTAADKDALFLDRMEMTDRAWLQTTLTGPARVVFALAGFRSDSNTGIRVLLNDRVAFEGTRFSTGGLAVQIPDGTHALKFEFLPYQPIPQYSGLAVSSVTITPQAAPPVAELLDAPGLEWAATAPISLKTTMTAVTTGTHDGSDALGLVNHRLAIGLTGPGLLTFWLKAGDTLALDQWPVPVTSAPSSTWVPYSIPVPQGRHAFFISGQANTVVDELSFQSLPALSVAEALDAPADIGFLIPEPDSTGAAAYPGLSEDGSDSFLLMPGHVRRVALRVPPLSQISLRVRAAFNAGTFGFQELASIPTSTTWTTRRFSTQTEGGQDIIYLRARDVPVLLDQLTVVSPRPDSQYFPWARTAGLPPDRQDPAADPDGDGLSNFAEYAYGLDPVRPDDAHTPGTDTRPGLPEVTTVTDPAGATFLEVRYWQRRALTARVETTTDLTGAALLGQPDGWASSNHPPQSATPSGDWIRVVWRAPQPITAGTRLFARVRTIMP